MCTTDQPIINKEMMFEESVTILDTFLLPAFFIFLLFFFFTKQTCTIAKRVKLSDFVPISYENVEKL